MKAEIIVDTRQELSPRVSIIVPVYNTAAWVEMTLGALCSPLLADDELIVIDDGSIDDSLAKLPGWLSAFPGQVLLLRQPNQGLSAARNTGLCMARGRWLSFCDSDDWLNASVLSAAICLGEKKHADAVFWRSEVYDDIHQCVSPFYDEHAFNMMFNAWEETALNIYNAPYLLALEPNINTALYKRSVWIDSVGFFQQGKVYEDLVPHYRMLFSAKNIQLIDQVGYYYRIGRPGKITEQRSRGRRDMIDAVAGLMNLVPENLSPMQLHILMMQVLRLLHWCGVASLPADRRDYYQASCHIFHQGLAKRILLTAFKSGMPVRQSAIALALLVGNTKSLCRMAEGYGWLSMVYSLPSLALRPMLWPALLSVWKIVKKGNRS